MNPETVNHTDRDHAEFSPSALKYLHKCPGFHGHDTTSAASEKGTRIHEALEIRDPSALQDEDEVDIYGQLIKDEEDVFDMVFGGGVGVTIYREERLYLNLDAKTPTFGTADIVAMREDVGLIADYKTGISRIDEVEGNWQAMAYALGMLQTYPHLNVVKFAFLVPRANGIMAGEFTREKEGLLKDQISAVVRLAEQTRPKWETGEMDIDDVNPNVNCRFCRHGDHCPALGAVAIGIATKYRPDLMPSGPIDPNDIANPETAEKLYTVAKIVEGWAKGVKFKVTGMAHDGVEFDGLHLRSMGALKKTLEKNYLAQLAIQHGLSLQEVIEAADLTLNQLSEALHAKAPKGKKTFVVDSFQKEAIDTGVVEVGPTRYTLSSK